LHVSAIPLAHFVGECLTTMNLDMESSPPAPAFAKPHGGGEPWRMMPLAYVGLSLVYWGLIAGFLGVLLALCGNELGEYRLWGMGKPVAGVVILLGFGLDLLSAAASFVGALLCLDVPAAARARRWLIVSLALPWIGFVSAYFQGAMPRPVFMSLASIVILATAGAFVMYLSRLARFIDEPQIAARAKRILVVGGALQILLLSVPLLHGLNVRYMGVIVLLSVTLLTLYVFAGLAHMINDLRRSRRGKREG
jgi:hypothetical protein